MIDRAELLLVAAVAAVGILHTVVPDHWLPISLMARQRGWSTGETARAAMLAGTGHVLSTLLIALAVWLAGVAFAQRFGRFVDAASSLALIGFGGFMAVAAWRELRRHGGHGHTHGHPHGHDHRLHPHSHGHHDEHGSAVAPEYDALYAPLGDGTAVLTRHLHPHRHGRGPVHVHWHEHTAASSHAVTAATAAAPPLHDHRHPTTLRGALLLILGSSPMVEGIPAFFAAGRYGAGLIAAMAAVFAGSTIVTYLLLCTSSSLGLQRLRLGAWERYGEVASGALIAGVGVAFWLGSL
jgi:nickel/cobalt transporter (NicO) family protein